MPRPKQRVREARQALYRQLVLEAGERVFAEKGYDDAKMEELAREAGIALGTLYSVVSGKAEVFRAIHEQADGELLRAAAEAARGVEDPLEALLAGIRAWTRYFLERPDFLRMHLREGLAWGGEAAGAGSRRRTRAWREGIERLAQAFARCVAAGVFEPGDPRLAARTMVAMQQVQLAHWFEDGMRRDPEAVVADIVAQVVRCFGRRGSGPG